MTNRSSPIAVLESRYASGADNVEAAPGAPRAAADYGRRAHRLTVSLGRFRKTMQQPVERRLAAILAADVAGYSRLMGANEEGTLQALKGHRRQLFDPKIKEHRGRIVKTTGDGMLVEFPSVVDAVRCAVEVQRAMLDRNAEIPEDKRIVFRIGVNLGDVIVDGDDLYGDGVNIAARLEALAEPGGVCISWVVRDQIRDKLSRPFTDMGEQRVKNIARPLTCYAMSAAAVATMPLAAEAQPALARPRTARIGAIMTTGFLGGVAIAMMAWWAMPNENSPTLSGKAPATAPLSSPTVAAGAPLPRLSIVVLPFANLSDSPDQEYFADAITEDLTTDLSRIAGTFVIAPTTAFTYKGKGLGAKQIGRELGVGYVLDGSVRRTGDHVQCAINRCRKWRTALDRPARERSRRSRESPERDYRPYCALTEPPIDRSSRPSPRAGWAGESGCAGLPDACVGVVLSARLVRLSPGGPEGFRTRARDRPAIGGGKDRHRNRAGR